MSDETCAVYSPVTGKCLYKDCPCEKRGTAKERRRIIREVRNICCLEIYGDLSIGRDGYPPCRGGNDHHYARPVAIADRLERGEE